jgi:hypothetical protein
MMQINQLKIIVAVLSASTSYICLIRKGKQFDNESNLKFYIATIIRYRVLHDSIEDNWPIELCTTINLIITIMMVLFI